MKNTTQVIIPINEYDELIKLKEEISKEKVYVFTEALHKYGSTMFYSFYTKEEVHKKLEAIINDLCDRNKENKLEIEKIKKYSIWEFLKWRKS